MIGDRQAALLQAATTIYASGLNDKPGSVEDAYALLAAIEQREQKNAPKSREALERANKWVVNHRRDGDIDYACAECIPHSQILIAGFQCVYHAALKEAP